MTDTTAATPTPSPVAEPFEPSPGALEFVHQGIIRVHFPTGKDEDRIVRVRRPFLGELKAIRLALAEVQDELAVMATTVALDGGDLRAEAIELSRRLGAEEVSREDHATELADIRRRDREAGQRMDDLRETRILAWWAVDVFGVLALDEVPDVMEYPAWILDARLPNYVLNHWRQIPSGPG